MLKKIKGKIVSVVAGFFGVTAAASAAVPVGVSTALGDSATDAATIGGLALVAVVAAVSLKYARRAL